VSYFEFALAILLAMSSWTGLANPFCELALDSGYRHHLHLHLCCGAEIQVSPVILWYFKLLRLRLAVWLVQTEFENQSLDTYVCCGAMCHAFVRCLPSSLLEVFEAGEETSRS
jgi:hypothetical protein